MTLTWQLRRSCRLVPIVNRLLASISFNIQNAFVNVDTIPEIFLATIKCSFEDTAIKLLFSINVI